MHERACWWAHDDTATAGRRFVRHVTGLLGLLAIAGPALAEPDLSALSDQERRMVMIACGHGKAEKQSRYEACVQDQLAALARRGGAPELWRLIPEDRRLIETACLGTRPAGPAPYYACLDEQIAALSRSPAPDLSRFSPDHRRTAEGRCRSKRQEGAGAYHACVTDQLAALSAPASVRRQQDHPAWPAWKGERPAMPPSASGPDLAPAQIYERASRSVYVVIAGAHRGVFAGDLRNTRQGSAVAVSDTMALTNCHVLKDRPMVLLQQRETRVQAKLAHADPESDRCILRAAEPALAPIAGVRPADNLGIGERVYAIGAPRGLELTLAEGLISALRSREALRLVQTTAPASPGSSGGGLFDGRGNLVAITTAGIRDGQNLNFAIVASDYWN